ncbi:hypothetical protein NLG97_g1243 [Lecanicillium saksenae]|uniref:Uncharacterized protein n=1 Tax=Lecanicillium saksenae TaxID=468837 RepID=A0ACC1R6X5_9HYPO|nr:hypothetical protein NLG97_g1243 [Lecanicillium saksenae]
MMPRFQLWAVTALIGLNIATVTAADAGCVPTCVNDIQNPLFAKFGCDKADDPPCLCRSQDFIDAVGDCSKKCNPSLSLDEFRQGLTASVPNRFCVDHANEMPNPRNLGPESSAPASTSTPASTAPPSTSSASPTSTSTPVSTSTTLATSTTSGTHTSGTSTSGSATSSHTSTTTSAAAGETSSAAATPVPANGISSGAAAGIGIGVAIVVVAVAVIAFCLLRKRKGPAAPRHSMEISKPLPGSGRTYPAREDRDRDRDSYDKYGNDIEMTSNRYEDMVPSQQPRTMV